MAGLALKTLVKAYLPINLVFTPLRYDRLSRASLEQRTRETNGD